METMTAMTVNHGTTALSRAGIQDPSVLLGTRCVQGDLQATRGQVRPDSGGSMKPVFRTRPIVAVLGSEPALGYVPFAGNVSPGGLRQT